MRRAAFLFSKSILYADIGVALASAAALFGVRAMAYATGENILGEGPWFLRLLVLTVLSFVGAPILMIPYLLSKDALARAAGPK